MTPALVHIYAAPYAAPARVIEYVAPSLVIDYIASPSTATGCFLNLETTGFANPQFSVPAVEASASQVVGCFPSVDEVASPGYNQVHQEQIAADSESVERVQQHTVEQIVHVPIPQIQEQVVESVQVIPRELEHVTPYSACSSDRRRYA